MRLCMNRFMIFFNALWGLRCYRFALVRPEPIPKSTGPWEVSGGLLMGWEDSKLLTSSRWLNYVLVLRILEEYCLGDTICSLEKLGELFCCTAALLLLDIVFSLPTVFFQPVSISSRFWCTWVRWEECAYGAASRVHDIEQFFSLRRAQRAPHVYPLSNDIASTSGDIY